MLFICRMYSEYIISFFFFFQAEDGIRDVAVTGVQTCALPISGGERQRVALARAVLQKASVLIFDESSSALDAATERRIFANLAQHFRRETCILISHRISALRWVDRIVVLEQGGIQEQGTHDQLIQRGGRYA